MLRRDSGLSLDMESEESPVSSTGWNSSRSSASSIQPPKLMDAIESFFRQRERTMVSNEDLVGLMGLIDDATCLARMEQNERLKVALERLGKEHGEMRRVVSRQERKHERDRQREMQAQEKLKKEKLQAEEDRKEAESVMEAMREETEKVMAELEASERRAVQYRGQVERLERDLLEGGNPEEGLLREARIQSEGLRRDLEDQAIASREREKSLEDQSKVLVHRHTLQVAALTLEKEELRQRLVKAEQRSSENAKGWEVERKKVKVQGDRELEEALGRSVAEKEKELALLKKTLEKNERAMEKTEAVYAQRLERECAVHRQDLQEGLQKQYRQQTDAFQLQVTRELRAMACQIADLETDLESAARENRQQQKVILALQAGASTLQDIDHRSLQQRQATEKELQTTIAQLHIQVASLEKESLVLYSKNLELAHQLGELEP